MTINQDNFSSIKNILEAYNTDYEVLSLIYKDIKDGDKYRKRAYLEVFHKTCGNITTISACRIIDNKLSCSKCAFIKKNKIDFKKEFYDTANGEYDLLSEYEKATSKIKVKHKTCGHIYDVTPNKWLMGRRCPNCGGPKQMNHTKFKKEFYNTANGEYDLLSEYVRANVYVKVKHKTCGHIYDVTPNKWLMGRRCPKCVVISHGENEIFRLLTEKKCNFKKEVRFKDCRDKLPLPFDFAVYRYDDPEKLLFLIEFDGWGHYSYRSTAKFNKTLEDLKKVQKHDHIKTKYCHDNNIPLLRIRKVLDIEKSIEKMFNDYPDRE